MSHSDLAFADALDPRRDALFLDVDGTLVGIRSRPGDVIGDPELFELLRGLSERLQGRVAAVSGRSIADVDRILSGTLACVAGVHGLERRRAGGEIVRPEPPAGFPQVLQALQAFAARDEGLILENKGLSVALHYRNAPSYEAEALALTRDLAQAHGMKLQPGRMVVEVRAPEGDKGAAIRAYMEEPPFKGARPVFAGDDLTDEAGFEAAAALGGYGVLVGAARPTAAARRLEDEAAVRDWLRRSLKGALS
jgi:trehalose 6-phosphate phosphatase